jgi:hypothetical protein
VALKEFAVKGQQFQIVQLVFFGTAIFLNG